MEGKKRLFIDMDGTLAEFRQIDELEMLFEEGYFLNLSPNDSVLDAVRIFQKDNPDVEVFVLSAFLTDSQYALKEKNQWLDLFLPEIDSTHRIFVPCGTEKTKAISNLDINDYLLDDYTVNLRDWDPPASGIKLLNGINGTRGTWKKTQISFMRSPEELATALKIIVKDHLQIRDINPNKTYNGKER